MGSQTTTSNQSSSSQPWAAAQPALRTGLQDAQSLYASGVGSQPYTGSMVTPMASQTTSALSGIQNAANNNTGYMDNSINQLQNIASGGMNQSENSFISGVSTGNSGFGNNEMMNNMASGEYLDGSNNPHFASVLARTQDQAMQRVNQQANQAGRTSSARHGENAARGVADVTGQMLSNQYNQGVQNMFGAQNRLDNVQQQTVGNAMNAQNLNNNQNSQNISNIMGAAGALPGAFQGSLNPFQALQGVGSSYEDLYTRQTNDQARVHDAQQNAPWNQLARLNAIASGAGSLGGSSTGTASQTTPTNWAGILGNAALAFV